MVCRLVENRQIDRFEQKLYHGKPASLSTRKIPDIFFIGFASKHKRSQYIVYLKAYFSACSPVNSVVNRYVFVQKLCLVLRIVSNVNVMPYLQFPSKRNLPHNALHERWFAFAVSSNKCHLFATSYGKIHIRENQMVSITFFHVFAYYWKIAASSAGRKL